MCINQFNVQECNQQVRLMRSIYKRATRVNIWLGSPFPGVEDTFKRLNDYAYYADLVAMFDGSSAGQSATRITRATARVFEFEWWERVWILQESVMARKANVFCGACFMDFPNLLHAYRHLSKEALLLSGSLLYRAAGISAYSLLNAL